MKRWVCERGFPIALKALCAAAVVSLPAFKSLATLNGDPNYFPVGVFYQPQNSGTWTASFTDWANRGVNTLVGYESQSGTVSISQWQSAAQAAGLKTIRQADTSSTANLAADAASASSNGVVGWLQPDEPESNSNITPATTLATYQQLKAVSSLPVMMNFDGSRVLGLQGGVTKQTYQSFMAGADVVAEDIYPVTGWGLSIPLTSTGQAVAQTMQYSTNNGTSAAKATFAFIETSNQNLSWVPNDRAPTNGQFREEVWDALIHGATGIMYFPQQIGGGFAYDATPANIAREMTAQNNLIQSLAPALNSTTPSNISGLTLGNSGLEAMVKKVGNINYLFVLNTTGSAINGQTITGGGLTGSTYFGTYGGGSSSEFLNPVSGEFSFIDSFAADSVNIYTLSNSSVPTVIVPVPEPVSLALVVLGAGALVARPSRKRRAVAISTPA